MEKKIQIYHTDEANVGKHTIFVPKNGAPGCENVKHPPVANF